MKKVAFPPSLNDAYEDRIHIKLVAEPYQLPAIRAALTRDPAWRRVNGYHLYLY